MAKFGAELKAFAGKTSRRMEAVAKDSIQDVLDIAQTPKPKGGRMPVDTSFLRNSLASGLNGSFGPPSAESYTLTIAEMTMDDVARFSWTAEYALRMELGFNGTDSLGRTYAQSGNHFAGSAAAQWQQIVTANANKA